MPSRKASITLALPTTLHNSYNGQQVHKGARREQLQHIRHRLQAIAHEHQRSLRELAIAWVLHHRAVTGAITGIRNHREATEMVSMLDWQLRDELMLLISQVVAEWE